VRVDHFLRWGDCPRGGLYPGSARSASQPPSTHRRTAHYAPTAIISVKMTRRRSVALFSSTRISPNLVRKQCRYGPCDTSNSLHAANGKFAATIDIALLYCTLLRSMTYQVTQGQGPTRVVNAIGHADSGTLPSVPVF
jgi:hypothetical protein